MAGCAALHPPYEPANHNLLGGCDER